MHTTIHRPREVTRPPAPLPPVPDPDAVQRDTAARAIRLYAATAWTGISIGTTLLANPAAGVAVAAAGLALFAALWLTYDPPVR